MTTSIIFTDKATGLQVIKSIDNKFSSMEMWIDATAKQSGFEVLHVDGNFAALKINGRATKLQFVA